LANLLVTGGTGQIGVFVSAELAAQGHRVTIFDLNPNPDNLSFISGNKPEVVKGDVLNVDQLMHALKSHEITHIVHLAALLVLESKQNPSRALSVNCIGTNNIFEAARQSDIQRVVFTSSVAVYGSKRFFPRDIVNEEDFPHCPVDPYSITKLTNELTGEYYRQSYGLDILCLRLSGAWGPGRYTGYTGQFNDFIRKAAMGGKAELPEDFAFKDAKLRWMYVKDAGACLAHATMVDKARVKRGLYNAGTSKPFNSFDLIKLLKKDLPDNDRITYKETSNPTELSAGIAGPSGLDVDCSRLYEELGFVEKMDLSHGVSDMINVVRSASSLI
jgi:nucleoside-diphosphate-sugar epimerase